MAASRKHLENNQKRDKNAIELLIEDAINNTSKSTEITSKNVYTKELNESVAKAKQEINCF